MPMPKRKPAYNPTSTMQELLTAVCDFYGDPVDDRVDDRNEAAPDHVSLHDVAKRFNITVMKARKLLITGNLYSTAASRKVQELHAAGLTVAQITSDHRGNRPEAVKREFLYPLQPHCLQTAGYQHQSREAETIPCPAAE